MEFGEKLQELRKDRGLTQEELAESLFVSRTAISKWESGRGYPNIESLKEISKFFSVSIDDLFTFILIILPIYPKTVEGYIYSVNLMAYTEITSFNQIMYWMLFISLILLGALKIIFVQSKIITKCSMILSVIAVIFLALAREAYAVILIFLLLLIKAALLRKKIF